MNPLILISLLCIAVSRAQGAQEIEATYSGELAGVTRGSASGDGLQSLLTEDDELEVDDELSGGDNDILSSPGFDRSRDERGKRKGKGKKKNRQKSKSTTPFNPDHTFFTSGHTSTFSSTQDPCTTSHLGYCIHGYCKYMERLQEPVCICMKGYDGERCGIQTLEVGVPKDERYSAELVQTILVVIAVVLSVISCCAVLLMACAHYRSQKNFLASYLGTGSEQEKLKKPAGDLV
ncbi:proheparin-binding EGF-like growth factor [Cololabis saira]|uniref:proheparin-binding EGF-like growth factor n=1 Tax=Cololabis saira TaxID=129043 RepID=UPI002AD49CA2|nr:proheparin-binding EGF-like growth factor [Cololabis saira]